MRTASFASRAPLVFGNRRNFMSSMKSIMFENGTCLPERSARRNATDTISVPLAISASRIASFEENFPVPTSNREVNSRSAIFSLEGLSDITETYSQSCRLRIRLGSAERRSTNSFAAIANGRAKLHRAAVNRRPVYCANGTQGGALFRFWLYALG